MKARCRHCHEKPANRARGLCYGCYTTPEIMALYPPTSKFVVRGVSDKLPTKKPAPTQALPGTAEKIAVMAARARAGEHLYHEHDGRR